MHHIALNTELDAECHHQASSVGGYRKHFATQTYSCRLLARTCSLDSTPLVRLVVDILYRQVHHKSTLNQSDGV